jgi:hypothetical protein
MSTSEFECVICLGEISSKDKASLDGCSHSFCFDCIKKWGNITNSCPMCKKQFVKILHNGTETLNISDSSSNMLDEELESYMLEPDYCHGCETGTDCIDAHTDWCNLERGIYN